MFTIVLLGVTVFELIFGVVTGMISFVGQQHGKDRDWQRTQYMKEKDNQLKAAQDLCTIKNDCAALNQIAKDNPVMPSRVTIKGQVIQTKSLPPMVVPEVELASPKPAQ